MILIEKSNTHMGVTTLWLNRVDKHNALSADLVAALIAQLKLLHAEASDFKLRTLIIASKSTKAFCAGADLNERKLMNEAQVVATLDTLQELTTRLAAIPCPTIAVIEGVAFGGGLELALSCDMRVASPHSQLGLTETRLAIIPGAGGTQRLSRLVGFAKAKEWIFTGARLSSEQALRAGLLNASLENPMNWALEKAQQIAEGGPIAILAAKEAIEKGYEQTLGEGLKIERTAYQRTLSTSDRIEGLKAFTEKRKAVYKGH